MSRLPPDNAGVILSLFEGRSDYHAEQQTDGSYLKCVGLTLKDIEGHLEGTKTVGVYPLKDGKVTFAVLDFDSKTPQARDGILYCREWLKKWGIPGFIEPSGSKGSHLWSIFKNWVPADKVRKVYEYLLYCLEQDVGTNYPVEIFPKQSGGVELGNLIKLPFGVHRKSNKRTEFLDEQLQRLPDCGLGMLLASPVIPEGALTIIIDEIPETFLKAKEVQQAPPVQTKQRLICHVNISNAAVPEGERDVTAFRYAVHLYRQGIPIETAEVEAITWDEQHCIPPLGARIIKQKVKQAYIGKYGYGCLEHIIQQYCDVSCPIYKRRHLQGDGFVPTAKQADTEIDDITEIMTDPPIYQVFILYKGAERYSLNHLLTKQLESPSCMDTKAFELLGFHPFMGIKHNDWLRYLDTFHARGKLTQEDAPIDASRHVRILNIIYDFIERSPKAETKSDIDMGRPVEKDDRYYFKIEHIKDMLSRRYRLSPGEHILYDIVRNAGGGGGRDKGPVSCRVGKHVVKGWYLPKRMVQITELEEIIGQTDQPKDMIDF